MQIFAVKNIINKNNQLIEHKHIIFFSDFDFKRMFSFVHILIDGTYIFSLEFAQPLIIMYYGIIIFKFIPELYILMNNKTTNGYIQFLEIF